MSIEIKQNGKKTLMPIWSTEIGLVDFNKNFKGKNVDEALKELKEDKTNILKTIGNVNVETDGDIASQLKDMGKNLSQLSNPNLLINGDFQVWQRGTSFEGSNMYTADRWITNFNARVRKNDKGISILANEQYGGIRQLFEIDEFRKLCGQMIILSIKVTNVTGRWCLTQKIYGDGVPTIDQNSAWNIATDGIYKFSMQIPENMSQYNRTETIFFGGANDSCNIEWVKLELGSVATPFVPRLYGEELALCQRYYQRYTTKGAVYDTNNLIINEMFTVSMRTIPTVKITNDILFDINQFKEIQFTISSLNVYSTYIGNILSNENNLVKGNLYVVSIILDAEIY